MRGLSAVLLAAAVGGCTSVKMVQREGCWVRRTEKIFGQVDEEVGPCARPTSPWVEDRLTRLTQECIAREDYRWQSRALAAFNRREPLPPQATDENVLRVCMNEAARAAITDNEKLKLRVQTLNERLAEVSTDRDALTRRADDDRSHLHASHDRIAGFLGEAAKKASTPAVATATASSDGRARMDSKSASPQTAPVAVVASAPVCAAPASGPQRKLSQLREGRKSIPREKAVPCDSTMAAKPGDPAAPVQAAQAAPTPPASEAANGEGQEKVAPAPPVAP